MKSVMLWVLLLCIFPISVSFGSEGEPPAPKTRILVVSSYHREYSWSQEINQVFCDGMLRFGYFDDGVQAKAFTKGDYVETGEAVVRKIWMDTKRKNSKEDLAVATGEIVEIVREFDPDLIFLGDDNAINYIGSQFLDSPIPIVFWGLNSNPLKYGLVDSVVRPGHNVTGVYQTGYFLESLQLLKNLRPEAKTFAVISDDSETGRANYKTMTFLDRSGTLPMRMTGLFASGDFDEWKKKVVELEGVVDAFFITMISSFRDESGNYVAIEDVAKWYLAHVGIPEASVARHFVEHGMLCAVDDSGYKQAYEAVAIAHDILENGKDPSTYPPVAPSRGSLVVNRQRAEMLDVVLTRDMGIEEYVETISSLEGDGR